MGAERATCLLAVRENSVVVVARHVPSWVCPSRVVSVTIAPDFKSQRMQTLGGRAGRKEGDKRGVRGETVSALMQIPISVNNRSQCIDRNAPPSATSGRRAGESGRKEGRRR